MFSNAIRRFKAFSPRAQKAFAASAAAVCSRVVGMTCQLFMVPMMLTGLGKVEYGEWLTLQAILGFLVFGDFGIGNGAMNRISFARARDGWAAINSVTSAAVGMLCGVGTIVLLAAGICSVTLRPLGVAEGFFAVYFAVVLPISFVERLFAALQEGATASIARAAAAIGTLLLTWVTIASHASFQVVCLATLIPTIAAYGISWWVATIQHPALEVKASLVSAKTVSSLLRQGAWFFVLQACATLTWATDSLLISSTLGVAEVPGYAVPQRLFAVILLLTSTLIAPLWPAYADAEACGDTAWMGRMLTRSFFGSLVVAGSLSAAIAIAMPRILKLWVGDEVVASAGLAWGMATVTAVYATGTALAMYLNGRSHIRIQVALATLQTILTLGLKAWLLPRYGIGCLPWITALVYVCLALVPTWLYLREAFRLRGAGLGNGLV